jgi:short subunit dehydrogenase-like uncharacterized protein
VNAEQTSAQGQDHAGLIVDHHLEIGQREHDEDQQGHAGNVAEDLDVAGQHEAQRRQRQQPEHRHQNAQQEAGHERQRW